MRAPQWCGFDELYELLPASKKLRVDFSDDDEVQRVVIRSGSEWFPAVWIDSADEPPLGVPPPHPGARGILAIHPLGKRTPVQVVRKVVVPKFGNPHVVVRACAEAGAGAGRSDWIFRLKVHDGTTKTLHEEVVASQKAPTRAGWRLLRASLADYAGREVLLVVECAAGGPRGSWAWERAFLDFVHVRQ
jgi:hypothetical protein